MKRSVHVPVVRPEDLGPNSPLLALKQRKKPADNEHKAQVRMYEMLDEIANTARGRDCGLGVWLPIIHAIPQFTDRKQGGRQVNLGKRYKAEGQRKGMPDNHVPVPRWFTIKNGHSGIASLYVELKFDSYPSEAQREQFQLLAAANNAVVTVKVADVETLAHRGAETIVRYIEGSRDFAEFGHKQFTHIPITL